MRGSDRDRGGFLNCALLRGDRAAGAEPAAGLGRRARQLIAHGNIFSLLVRISTTKSTASGAIAHSTRYRGYSNRLVEPEQTVSDACGCVCGFWSFPPHTNAVCPVSRKKASPASCQQSLDPLGLPAVRSVAQPGSALDWGSRGRGFESRRSDQKFHNESYSWRTPLSGGQHPVWEHLNPGMGLEAPRKKYGYAKSYGTYCRIAFMGINDAQHQ